MDYEKKYNEALKWMLELYPGLHGATKEDAEHYFPELRESEDERVIRTLYYLVRDHDWLNGAAKGEALAWLEKQKEQKPELVQQPPITYTYNSNASREERLKAALLALLNSDLLKVKEGGYFTKQDLIEWVERIPTDKPAEWSEVELEFRGEKVKVKRPFYRDDKGRGYSTTEQDEDVAWNALRAWCEKKGISLYDLYPKAEWSEEDADILNCCISSIEEAKENRYAYKETDGDTSYDHEIAWLKSLRPSWKPSEGDIKMLEHIIGQYETWNKNSKVMGYLPRVEELSFLKKVLSKWKN